MQKQEILTWQSSIRRAGLRVYTEIRAIQDAKTGVLIYDGNSEFVNLIQRINNEKRITKQVIWKLPKNI